MGGRLEELLGDVRFLGAYSKNVDNTKDNGNNPRGDNNSPERDTKGFLACCLFIKVTENGHTHNDHKQAKCDEARREAEQRPVTPIIASEQWELRNN